ICTPSSRANSLPRVQDGPDHGSPAPLVFCASQGGLLTTPTRRAPALRIASTRALTPGAGGVWAKAEMPPPSKAAASAPRPTRPTALPARRATVARAGSAALARPDRTQLLDGSDRPHRGKVFFTFISPGDIYFRGFGCAVCAARVPVGRPFNANSGRIR